MRSNVVKVGFIVVLAAIGSAVIVVVGDVLGIVYPNNTAYFVNFATMAGFGALMFYIGSR